MAKILADRHYNRQTPESDNFAPPGRCIVLYTETDTGKAFWITSFPFARYVKHKWKGAWVCSAFRNENAALSSMLITQAVAATRHFFGPPPALGMITFVDKEHVAPKRQLGWCYLKAKFKHVGYSEGGLVALQLLPKDMPSAQPPLLSYNPEHIMRRRA